MTMDKVMYALRMWMERNGLPTEGVEVQITMPGGEDAYRAKHTMMAEMAPHLITDSTLRGDGKDRLYGIPIKFTGPPRR